MTKLHQLLAVAKDKKQWAQNALTGFYHQVQKPDPFNGITKVYRSKDEDGEALPGESQRVQLTAVALLRDLRHDLNFMYEVVGDIDRTNMTAAADIVIDNQVILANVPVATLLWLEKQLADMRTVFQKLPTLNPEFQWEVDETTGVWTTAERVTTRAKKIPRNHVKASATDKHPAQVEVYYEDQIVGTWHTRGLSGAMRAIEVKALQVRLEALRYAVKDARERANATEAQQLSAVPVLDYLFAEL